MAKQGYSAKCSVCTHKDAELINDMLRRRALGESTITLTSIVEQMEQFGRPITLCALSRHASNHFDVAAEGRRRAAEQFEHASGQVAEKTYTDLTVLDAIRDKAMQLMESGEIRPDIKDMIAAIGTKHGKVMKEANPVAELFDLVAATARSDDE